jgi:FtsP/CotA-like multicopper oxidase with cupredoxin domain
MDPLPIPGVAQMAAPNYYEIGAWQIQQQLHSQLPPTTVYGYGTSQATAGYPGPTIVAQKGVPISIRWSNHLPMNHILEYAFDPTIMGAVTTTGVPIATHVHGAEVEPQSDGGPMTWFTPGFAEKVTTGARGPRLREHAASGDDLVPRPRVRLHAAQRVRGARRLLHHHGSRQRTGRPSRRPVRHGHLHPGPDVHDGGPALVPERGETERTVWIPEFFGDAIVVNGKVWPYLNVEPRKYRFRFLNGAQARFFSLALADRMTGAAGPAFRQIATDGDIGRAGDAERPCNPIRHGC